MAASRKTIEYADEFRVSQRVTLKPGDLFRVKGGPYWKSATGEKLSLASKGPFRFVRHCRRGSTEWIESLDKFGAFAPLHIAGSRRRIDSRLVARPYVVVGKKRKKKPPTAKP
jgi:hypothetical protein